jgi:hypothetical protein
MPSIRRTRDAATQLATAGGRLTYRQRIEILTFYNYAQWGYTHIS